MTDRSVSILHLSDLHCGQFFGFKNRNQFLSLMKDALHEARTRGISPDLVCISGDVSSIGALAELKEGALILHEVCKLAGLPPERLVVSPGNHEVSWFHTKAAAEGRSPEDAAGAARGSSEKFEPFLTVFGKRPDTPASGACILPLPFAAASPAHVASVHYFEGLGTLVYALNSASMDSHLPEHHYGYVGDEQLRLVDEAVAARFEGTVPSGTLRVAIVHHPLMAPDDHDGSNLRDPIYFYNWLQKNRVHILLHGHQHYSRLSRITASLGETTIVGAGSTAVNLKHRNDAFRSFNLIRVERPAGRSDDRPRVSVSTAEFRRSEDTWKFDLTWDGSSAESELEEVRSQLPNLFSRVAEAIGRAKASGRMADLDMMAADVILAMSELLGGGGWVTKSLIDDITKTALNECTSILAVDVCGPRAWAGALAYRYLAPQVKRYLLANVKAGAWKLVVSNELGDAIDSATGQARRHWDPQEKRRVSESLTRFDNKPEHLGELSWKRGNPRLEFARVLRWSREELQSPIAEAIITVHNAFHIPLFYVETPIDSPERELDFIYFAGPGKFRKCFLGRRPTFATEISDGDFRERFFKNLAGAELMFAVDALEVAHGRWREDGGNGEPASSRASIPRTGQRKTIARGRADRPAPRKR